jgi:hypothetical protein
MMNTFLPQPKPTTMPVPGGKCIARLTVTREIGDVAIVEVYEGSTFHSFYWFHTQSGRRRSTKRLVRTTSRNEGLRPYYAAYRMTPGLEVLAERWKQHPGVKSVRVRIIRKKAYRRLISAPADELGLTKVHNGFREQTPLPVARMPIRLPQGYTPIEKRFEILTSK